MPASRHRPPRNLLIPKTEAKERSVQACPCVPRPARLPSVRFRSTGVPPVIPLPKTQARRLCYVQEPRMPKPKLTLTHLGHKSLLTDSQLQTPRSILDSFPNPKPARHHHIE